MKVYLLDGLWGRHWRLAKLAAQLNLNGFDSEIWTYDSSGRVEISILAERFLKDTQSEKFHAVGYSMGGLILREAMRLKPDLPLTQVAFLNTPHAGTLVANVFGFLGVGIREMQPQSSFLNRLNTAALGQHCEATLAVRTIGDLMVIPSKSASFEKGNTAKRKKNITLKLPAHVWPIYSSRLHLQITNFFLNNKKIRDGLNG
ncbi:MAG: esterase/lipase family protein [Chthoniobacterales bacterium]